MCWKVIFRFGTSASILECSPLFTVATRIVKVAYKAYVLIPPENWLCSLISIWLGAGRLVLQFSVIFSSSSESPLLPHMCPTKVPPIFCSPLGVIMTRGDHTEVLQPSSISSPGKHFLVPSRASGSIFCICIITWTACVIGKLNSVNFVKERTKALNLMWCLILCINFIGPQSTQILGQTLFWVCL